MNEIQALLSGPILPLVIGGVGILVVLWGDRKNVAAGLAWLKGKLTLSPAAPVVAPEADKSHARFAAVKLLMDGFREAGCKEGIAAAQVCLAHLLDHGGDAK